MNKTPTPTSANIDTFASADVTPATTNTSTKQPSRQQIKAWRKYLAAEKAEAEIYREFATRLQGEERAILTGIADAEARHEQHWRTLLGEHQNPEPQANLRRKVYGVLLRIFGSLFVLVLLQRVETRSPYEYEKAATPEMAADELVHSEVMRGLAAKGRSKLSSTFRAAVFGANDGLVSNLALVMGMAGAGAATEYVLASGVAGLLAGALSMAAGEYISVSSQRELLEASAASPKASAMVPNLDVDHNELALVYRARGMDAEAAAAKAHQVLSGNILLHEDAVLTVGASEEIGSGASAAISSFIFFASGAVFPVLPYLFGLSGQTALILALVLVGLALMSTGAIVGLLSGASPFTRALRQLAIGYGAAGITYALGMLFGVAVS